MDILFSFILPAYKADFLDLSISSILSQDYKNFELVIVNDASPQDIDSIVNKYDDSRITYHINSENIGGRSLVEQWNKSLNYAKGDYVILASDDDMYATDFLSTMAKLINTYPYYNVYGCRKKIINSSGNIVDVDGFLGEDMSFLEFSNSLFLGVLYSSIPNYIFRRSALVENTGFIDFPLAWYSDDATILRLAREGIAFSNDLLFSFRFSDNNVSSLMDERTFKLKVIATDKFYKWFHSEIKGITSSLQLESLYLNRMSGLFNEYIIKKTRYLIRDSSWKSILWFCLNRQYLQCISNKQLMKMLIYRIVK